MKTFKIGALPLEDSASKQMVRALEVLKAALNKGDFDSAVNAIQSRVKVTKDREKLLGIVSACNAVIKGAGEANLNLDLDQKKALRAVAIAARKKAGVERQERQDTLEAVFLEAASKEGGPKNELLARCVRAVALKKPGDKKLLSKAFSVCTRSLQKVGYVKPGTSKLTAKGKRQLKAISADETHSSKLKDYESLLKLVRKKQRKGVPGLEIEEKKQKKYKISFRAKKEPCDCEGCEGCDCEGCDCDETCTKNRSKGKKRTLTRTERLEIRKRFRALL